MKNEETIEYYNDLSKERFQKKIEKSPRRTIHIPRNSKTIEFLDEMSKDRPDIPLWMFFEEMISKRPRSKEEQLVALYDEFVRRSCELFGSGEVEETKLQILKKIILRKIFKIKSGYASELDADYYESLKKF